MTITQKRSSRYTVLALLVAGFAIFLIAMIVWGVSGLRKLSAVPPQASQTPAGTTTPVTEPSQPEATEPPTARERVEAFAAEHGYTLEDYPEKLIALLEKEPAAEGFVLNYPLEYGKDHAIDISGYANEPGVPLFLQWDKQWGYKDYVGNIAGLSGCGPTSLAMVKYYFSRDSKMNPAYMMDFAQSNKAYANETVATQWALFGQGAKELGLQVTELTGEQIRSAEKIAQVLDSGKVIIVHVGPGVFTEIGHYMVIWGHENGAFRINDPNSPTNSAKLWDFDVFADQVKMMWAFSE